MRLLSRAMLAAMSLHITALMAHSGDHSSINELNALLATTPDAPSLLLIRGATFTRMGQWDKAEQDFLRAKQIDKHINIDFELAQLYFQRNLFTYSLLHVNRYININPEYAPAYLLKARSAQASGQTGIAQQSWVDYLTIAPDAHPGDYLAAARLHASTGSIGVEKALELLDQGIKRIGLTAQLQGYAMQLELDRDQPTLAYRRWRSLENQLGATPKYKITLAQLLVLTDRLSEARITLEDAKTQLLKQRKTPARKTLERKLMRIEEQLG